MLDHMTFRVSDIARSKAFYAAALAPLGYAVLYEGQFDGANVVGLGIQGTDTTKIDTWLVDGVSPVSTGCHLAWRTDSHAAVDAFHAAALASGGTDNGAPGLRPHYHADYYGAFVVDPDGNNVEAVCHTPG
jgi:catechol 2,3-dioxygenase-like lactoylglutathione lyase family enzyme